MKKHFALFLILFSIAAQAQINLRVEFQSDSDDQVEVWLYDNFIIGSKHLVFTIDRNISSTNEKLIETDHYGKILVKTKHYEKSYYVQPGYSYTLVIQAKDIIIKSEDKTNEMILEIDALSLEYTKKGVSITGNYKKSYVPLMEELASHLATLFTDNTYFNNLLRYKIASIRFNIIQRTKDLDAHQKLELNYLTKPTVDYWNPKYISFIKDFYYWSWVLIKLRHIEFDPNEDNYQSYFNELAFAKNDTVRQIALLYFIKEASRSYWGGSKEYTNHLLDSLSKSAVNSTLKESIAYTHKIINSLNVGDKVADFVYYDINNKEARLSQYSGKYVLLDFWFIGCTECHKALPDLKKLQKKYKGCLEIVGINPVNNNEQTLKYKGKYNIGWSLLNARHDSNIPTYFNVIQYPTYFLIDPAGNFSQIPTNFSLKQIINDIEGVLKSDCGE